MNNLSSKMRIEAGSALMKAGYDIFENSGLCRHLKGLIKPFNYHVCCANPLLAQRIYQPLGMVRLGQEYTIPLLLRNDDNVKPFNFIPLLLTLSRSDERAHNKEFNTYRPEEYKVNKRTYLYLGSRHFPLIDRTKFFFWYLFKNIFHGGKSLLDFRDIKFAILDLIKGCHCNPNKKK